MLRVEEISAQYGDIKVLWKTSLTISSKEMVTMVGSNGSGKSTLLHILLGDTTPDTGTITRARYVTVGYLPQEAMLEISHMLGIPAIDIYSVVTFYNQFRLNPPGKHSIRVCLGTACHMKGGYITLDAWKRRLGIKRGETTPDREFDLDTVDCVGCCTMAPVSVVDHEPRAWVDARRVDDILFGFKSYKAGRDDQSR